MHPPQPPGGQQFARAVPGQPPPAGQQPYGGQAWPAGTEQAGSSGITSWVAALLGCFVALGTQVGMLVILLNRVSPPITDVLLAVGSIAVLSVPPLVGASGVLARKRFGRWLLVGGLVLPAVAYGWITYMEPLLWPLCFFVGSLAAIALALSPTTGNYLREGVVPDAVPQAVPSQPGYPVGQPGQQSFGGYQGFPGGHGDPRWNAPVNPQWHPQGGGYPPEQWPNQY
ncbi:hypothetical protein [Actinopolyspora halophila]|uniref:hypothetical protein n=1 Tax=Actinopolyspora halophila TaxID=1850 RepID=UPI00039EA59E|nr:hypothetical protein [Actinopolyspora halophila]